MSTLNQLLINQKRKLLKALDHLDYSYKKVLSLSHEIEELDEASLEPVQSLNYAGHKSRIFCDPLLEYSNVCSVTVLENTRFLLQPSRL